MNRQDCFYQVLGLSNQLMDAIGADEWTRVNTLQQQWIRDMQHCVETLMASDATEEVEQQLRRLLEDVAEKTALLERAIEQLRQQQQHDLRQLQQASAYLEQR